MLGQDTRRWRAVGGEKLSATLALQGWNSAQTEGLGTDLEPYLWKVLLSRGRR